MPKAYDLTGKRFGKLVAVKYMYSDTKTSGKGRGRYWLCKCDCGGEKITSASHLMRGVCTSCGCSLQENIKKAQEANVTHGMTIGKPKRLYYCYRAMLGRCKYEPNWVNKGIKVCDEWVQSPQSFFEWALSHGYQDNLTLDRINVYGNYEPSNCRWITKTEQQHNKTTNHYLTINGVTRTASQWSKATGISSATILKRVEHGYTEEELIKPTGTIYRTDAKARHSYKHFITINGKTQSISDWSKETGISYGTLEMRIRSGFIGEEIIAPKHSIYHGERFKNFNSRSVN